MSAKSLYVFHTPPCSPIQVSAEFETFSKNREIKGYNLEPHYVFSPQIWCDLLTSFLPEGGPSDGILGTVATSSIDLSDMCPGSGLATIIAAAQIHWSIVHIEISRPCFTGNYPHCFNISLAAITNPDTHAFVSYLGNNLEPGIAKAFCNACLSFTDAIAQMLAESTGFNIS